MGGRGSAGNGGIKDFSGIRFETKSGFKGEYFFKKENGINYYQKGLAGKPTKIPGNITKEKFLENLLMDGSKVHVISQEEKRKMEIARKKDREITSEFLIRDDLQNKVMKRGTRLNRIANRRRRK